MAIHTLLVHVLSDTMLFCNMVIRGHFGARIAFAYSKIAQAAHSVCQSISFVVKLLKVACRPSPMLLRRESAQQPTEDLERLEFLSVLRRAGLTIEVGLFHVFGTLLLGI